MEINSSQPVPDEFLEPNDYPLYPHYCWNGLTDASSRPFPPNHSGMSDVYTLREMPFKTSRGQTKHTQLNVETDNNQGLKIYALQGSSGNLYPFIFKPQTKDDILLLWTGKVTTIIDSITF